MLQMRNLHTWYAESVSDFITEDHYMRELAEELYAKEFKAYCEEFKEENKKSNETLDQIFMNFVEDYLDDNDVDTFYEVIELFAKKKGYKATLVDWTSDDNSGGCYTIHLSQLCDISKDDLTEIVTVYMEEQGSESALAEVVIEKLTGE